MYRQRSLLFFVAVVMVVLLATFIRFDRTVTVFKQVLLQYNPSPIASKFQQDKVSQWQGAVWKVHDSFHGRTLNSCKNICPLDDIFCQARTLDQLEKVLTSPKVKNVPLYSNNEFIFPWENDYLSKPPLQDIRLLPDLSLSKVYLFSDGRINYLNNITAQGNDRLVFRVDLVDGYGYLRPFGGDEVRVWISDAQEKWSMAGYVTDLRNGTYLAHVKVARPGTVKLNVAVVYPREYLRAALYHMKEGRHRFIFGLYRSGDVEEVTICHPTPNIPGRPCLCNYTEYNRRPFYCGRPLDTRLTCRDWVNIKSSKGPIAKDFTQAEEELASHMSRPLNAAKIRQEVVIKVQNRAIEEVPLKSCLHLDRRKTWIAQSPRGLWSKNRPWESFICLEPPMTRPWFNECLQNTHVWMMGDSNMFHMELAFRKMILAPERDKNFTIWSRRRDLYDTKRKITFSFRGHEYPLFHYLSNKWQPLLGLGGIEDYLGSIPSTGDHVVIIHYYLHMAISHLSVIFQRLVAVRDAVSALLARNPSVLIGFRGPHISTVEWETNHMFGGDVQGSFIRVMVHEVFRDLQDRVVFLDGWDMSISSNNGKMHPPGASYLLRTLLSFKCA